jgi:ketosteroid isomerase-like protein
MKNGGVYENDYLAILLIDEQGKILEWAEYYQSARANGLI